MADNKAKQDLLKKLKTASKYKKLQSVFAKETDKVKEYKLNKKDQKEISNIKRILNAKS